MQQTELKKSGNSSNSSESAVQILLLFSTVRQSVLAAPAYFPVQKEHEALIKHYTTHFQVEGEYRPQFNET